ncbi:MAG: acyl-CoA desaturase [Chloroflexi bacterium]|nr:acyl-CoA desaturase [Chloroflexota bacterium]
MFMTIRKPLIISMVVGPLLATAYAVYLSWNGLVALQDLALLAVMYTLVAFGVTVGYHRYVTHESFQANRVIKYALIILGCMSLEGAPIAWAANHRMHHAYSDREGDLHSPHHAKNMVLGFFHAHMGWLLEGRQADVNKWAKDLLDDKELVFLNKTAWLWFALSLLIPFAIGGWTGLLWGGIVRIFLTHHVTWSVNSVCHIFGQRPFKTKDESSNHWLVGLLAFGEGGHNTHHASPRSARHGLYWYHFDLSWQLIRLLAKLRLAWNVYTLDRVDLPRAIAAGAPGVKVMRLWPRQMTPALAASGAGRGAGSGAPVRRLPSIADMADQIIPQKRAGNRNNP